MRSNKKFFTGKQEMAVLKHTLLSNYLRPFATMTTSADPSVPAWYVDAYAGPGRYEPAEGVPSESGSPLIALGAARDLAHFNRARTLNCIFIEKTKTHYETLRSICETGRFGSNYSVIFGDAHSSFVDAVKATGSDPLLAFIDPFGTALPYSILESALRAKPKTARAEILLNFHLPSVARIGGLLKQKSGLSPRDEKTMARLDAFLGFEWKELFLSIYEQGTTHSATRAAQAVSANFREVLLKREGLRSLAIDVRKAGDIMPRFELTLYYRHDAAEYKFADAAHAANTKWRKRVSEMKARKHGNLYADSLLPEGFDEEQFNDQWIREEKSLAKDWESALANNIIALLRGTASFSIAKSVRPLYGDLIGMVGEKHLRAAWKGLAAKQITSPYDPEMLYATIARGPNWSVSAP